MKVSIITAVYNNQSTILDAIKSVQSQTYENIEHVLVDGLSTDGTTELIEKNARSGDQVIVEKDNGIYDALNKGIRAATGEVIGLLHSDDVFYDRNVVDSIVSVFEREKVDSVYGDINYVRKDAMDKVIRSWRSGDFKRNKFFFGWMPAHTSFFVKNKIYQEYGLFDTRYRIASDYELMLRYLWNKKVSVAYLPSVTTNMRVGGASNKSLGNILLKSKEDYAAINKFRLWGVFTLACKNVRKIPQFF